MWLYYRVMCPKGGDGMANSVDPYQMANLGAVGSGSTLFAQACLSENLDHYGTGKSQEVQCCDWKLFRYWFFCPNEYSSHWRSVEVMIQHYDCIFCKQNHSRFLPWIFLPDTVLGPYEFCICEDQPARPCSLISTFDVRCLDSIIQVC